MDPYRFNPLNNFEPLSSTQLEGYLARIKLNLSPSEFTPSLTLLNRILASHARTIPFENAQLLLCNTAVSIDSDAVYQRIVTERRGGYCFQVNILLLTALRALGFSATFGTARSSVWDAPTRGRILGAITHMIVFVQNLPHAPEATYLTDMGYNEIGLTQAIEVKVGATVSCVADEMHKVKLASVTGPGNFMLSHRRAAWAPYAEGVDLNDEFTDLYYFTMERYRPQDVEVLNYFVHRSERHKMQRHLVLSIVSATGGRCMIVDKKFRRREGALHRDLERKCAIESAEMFAELMRTEFGIDMGEEEIEGAKRRWFA